MGGLERATERAVRRRVADVARALVAMGCRPRRLLPGRWVIVRWHTGLPEDWSALPDPSEGKREIPPSPDVDVDEELEVTETDGVLVVRREGSSTAYVAGGYVDLEQAR